LHKIKTIAALTIVLFVLSFGVGLATSSFVQSDRLLNALPQATALAEPILVPQPVASPSRVNFAIFGMDNDQTRADVVLVASFNPETGRVAVLSIPRDTRVELSEQTRAELREAGRWFPSGGAVKMAEVHSYAGRQLGAKAATHELGQMLDVAIDSYFVVNLDAFAKIVDDLGGVTLTLERNYYYVDPVQKLSINLQAGEQTLDGKQAEGLVRFRAGYPMADLDRIGVQQMFLKELFGQALGSENIMKNAVTLAKAFLAYVETNFTIIDAIKYASYIGKINAENIVFETIPGTTKTMNGASYFIVDEEAARQLVNELFKDEQLDEG